MFYMKVCKAFHLIWTKLNFLVTSESGNIFWNSSAILLQELLEWPVVIHFSTQYISVFVLSVLLKAIWNTCLLYKGLSTSRLCSELGSFVLEIVVLQWKQGLEWLVNVYSSSMTDWNLVSHIRDVYFLQQETTTSWNLHLLTKLSKNMCSFVFLLSFSFIFEYFSTSLKYHDRKIWDLQHWKHKYNDSTDKSNTFIKQDL